MKSYYITYHIRGKESATYSVHVDASSVKYAKNKIGRKHHYKDGRMVIVDDYTVVGYY